MKLFSKAAVGGLLWLSFSIAFGTTLNVSSHSESINYGGQFTATLSSAPGQTLLIYCIDYPNELVNGDSVNISTPNPSASPDEGLANTRYGQTPEVDFSFYNSGTGTLSSGTAPLTAFQRYVLAGYLTTLFTFPGGTVTPADIQVQNAIWTLLTVAGTSGFPGSDSAGSGNYIATAEEWLATEMSTSAGQANLAAFESDIRIYTSTNTTPYTGPNSSYISGSQEMIGIVSTNTNAFTNTPEPATFALLGAGLLAVGLFSKRLKA